VLNEQELTEIEARAAATTGLGWSAGRLGDGAPAVVVRLSDGSSEQLDVTRERDRAIDDDVLFIAHARRDVERLIAAHRGGTPIAETELDDIDSRCARASPGPWKAFLETEGGLGGSNVIWVSERDDEPDLYLWYRGSMASDADFEFVASARQDIPRLVAAARARRTSRP
jgi:hypothetical protein